MPDRPGSTQDHDLPEAIEPRGVVNVGAVVRAAATGLVVALPVSVVASFVERETDDFDDSAWPLLLFVALLLVFTFTGWCAGRFAPAAPLTNGALSGLGLLLGWIPIRIVIWALRDDSRGLVSGDDPVFTFGGVFGLAIAAAGMGVLGGWLSSRRQP